MNNAEKSKFQNIIGFLNDKNYSLAKKYSLDYLNIMEKYATILRLFQQRRIKRTKWKKGFNRYAGCCVFK